MSDIHPDLLKRYAQGLCTEAEEQMVEQWLEHGSLSPPEDKVPLTGHTSDAAIKAELWTGIIKKAGRNKQRGLHKRWISGLAIAATLLLVGCLIFFKRYHMEEGQPQYTMIKYTAPKGNVVTLKLADGSVVTLSGGSSLRYPSHFAQNTRIVELLTGKAFFDIQHQPDRPFVIKSFETRIRVLGTRFDVDLTLASEMKVTLSQGSIAFYGQKQQQRLIPGEQLSYNRVTGKISGVLAIDTNLVNGWTSGTLWFKQTPLREVLSELEAYYGVKFTQVGGPDLSLPLSGKFQQQPLARILRLIENSSALKFELRDGNSIIVR